MSNRYKHIPDEMLSSADRLTHLLEEYNGKLQAMQKLIDTIDNSPAWKNIKIKQAFNNTCNSYMKINNDRLLKLTFCTMRLKEKARCAEKHERAYSQGGKA